MRKALIRSKCPPILLLISSTIVIALCSAWRAYAQVDQTLQQRFLQDAPIAWSQLCKGTEKLQGTYTYEISQTHRNESEERRIEIKMNQNCKLLMVTTQEKAEKNDDNGYRGEVFGINTKYAFQLQRRTPDSPWAIVGVDDLSKTDAAEIIRSRFASHFKLVTQVVQVDNLSLSDFIKKPYFQIRSCKSVSVGGDDLIQVAFECPHEVNQNTPTDASMIQSGLFVFDPRRFWALRSYDVSAKGANSAFTVTGTMKLRTSGISELAESPIVAQRVETDCDWTFTTEEPKSNKQRFRLNFQLKQPASLPGDEEFALTAFGLKEPVGLEFRAATPWFLYFIIATVSALLIGTIFGWLKRRTVG